MVVGWAVGTADGTVGGSVELSATVLGGSIYNIAYYGTTTAQLTSTNINMCIHLHSDSYSDLHHSQR